MENLSIRLPGTEIFIPGDILSELIDQRIEEKFSSIQSQASEALLTRKQAAQRLGVTLPTIHEWLKSGRLQGFRVGTRIRIKEADLKNSLKKIKTS